MSISSVSGSSSQNWQAIMQERKQDMEQLGTALQGGDMAAAQQAFTDLQGLNPTNQAQSASSVSAAASTTSSSSSTATSSQSTVASALSSLSQALQSGNLSDAQTAFSQLQTDVQAQKGGGHHHHHGGGGGGGGQGGNQIAGDFSALDQALQSGSLSDAQTAYTQLQTDMQSRTGQSSSAGSTTASTATTSTSASPQHTVSGDFTTLGQALQSGNLTDAQSAFAQIQSDFQSQIANRQGATYSATGSTLASATSTSAVTTVATSA